MKEFRNADKLVLQAMARLHSPEMAPLLKFFNELLEDSKDALVHAESDQFARLQGRAGVLKEFVEAVQKAPSAIERLR